MPLHIDEAWEYFAGDPEIEEVIYARKVSGFDGLGWSEDSRGKNVRAGMRFGKGNPNFCLTHLGREKPTRESKSRRYCKSCGDAITLSRSGGVYCDHECRARAIRIPHECAVCHKQFWKKQARRYKHCSRECYNASKKPEYKPDLGRMSEFTERYLRGEKRRQIAEALGIAPRTVDLWRTQLQLPLRRVSRGLDKCRTCGKRFKGRKLSRYCSVKCVPYTTFNKGRPRFSSDTRPAPTQDNLDTLRLLFDEGKPMKVIQAILGICRATALKWRKQAEIGVRKKFVMVGDRTAFVEARGRGIPIREACRIASLSLRTGYRVEKLRLVDGNVG